MTAYEGGCAVITGGAGLLGKAMALRFAREGMDIVIADIDPARMEAVAGEIRALGREALCVQTDVADPASMDALAHAAYSRFGKVNLLCLNAGRSILKPLLELTREDWNAVLGVQFNGVLNGMQSFLTRLAAQGDDQGPRHIVVTSSMSGVGRADLRQLNAPYVTAKFAVAGMSEVMAPSLAEQGIGISLLCPGMTVANPLDHQGRVWPMPSAAWYEDNLLDADDVADEVARAVVEGRFYIFPHHAGRGEVEGRHQRLIAGFDQAEQSRRAISEDLAS